MNLVQNEHVGIDRPGMGIDDPGIVEMIVIQILGFLNSDISALASQVFPTCRGPVRMTIFLDKSFWIGS